jgi:hypothetical protein
MEIQTLPTAELPPQKEKKPLLPRFVIALLALSLAGNAFQFWRGHPREQPNSGFQAGASFLPEVRYFLPEVRYSDVVRGIGSLVRSMEASESLSCRSFALVRAWAAHCRRPVWLPRRDSLRSIKRLQTWRKNFRNKDYDGQGNPVAGTGGAPAAYRK